MDNFDGPGSPAWQQKQNRLLYEQSEAREYWDGTRDARQNLFPRSRMGSYGRGYESVNPSGQPHLPPPNDKR
jgi:hypothetical protein